MIKDFFKENPRPTISQLMNFTKKQSNLYSIHTTAGSYITDTFYDFILRQPNDDIFIKFENTFNDSGYVGEIIVKSKYIISYYKINQ